MTGIILAGLVFLVYALLIGAVTYGWYSMPTFRSSSEDFSTPVSVIVAARNEAGTIGSLIAGLLRQDYPVNLLQVTLVDDHSGDGTLQQARHGFSGSLVSHQLLELSGTGKSGKKAAIDYGIQNASGRLVITTDADCSLPKTWISSMVHFYEQYHPKMILGPVRFSPSNTLFGRLQALEFMSLIATTAGSAALGIPLMANGANLAYEREAFLDCGGFAGNSAYPSGDDVFMMFSIKRKYGAAAIRFMKCNPAAVNTPPSESLREFIAQRLRWVSKSRGYSDPFIIAASFTVYLTNLLLLIALVWGIFSAKVLLVALIFYLFKLLIDFPLIAGISGFHKDRGLLWLFPLLEIPNAIYTVIIGLVGNLRSYTWKGRKISP